MAVCGHDGRRLGAETPAHDRRRAYETRETPRPARATDSAARDRRGSVSVFFVAASSGNLTGSTFESTDGNLVKSTGTDWCNAVNGSDHLLGTARPV